MKLLRALAYADAHDLRDVSVISPGGGERVNFRSLHHAATWARRVPLDGTWRLVYHVGAGGRMLRFTREEVLAHTDADHLAECWAAQVRMPMHVGGCVCGQAQGQAGERG